MMNDVLCCSAQGRWIRSKRKESTMSSQLPESSQRTGKRAIFDIALLIVVPTIIIYVISKVWK
jgi:hypothetical protein